jgi:hypothetical protein
MAMNILFPQDMGNVSTRRAIIAYFEALFSTKLRGILNQQIFLACNFLVNQEFNFSVGSSARRSDNMNK